MRIYLSLLSVALSLLLIPAVGAIVTYPTESSPGSPEVAGGTFNQYFTNMYRTAGFLDSAPNFAYGCANGQVVRGFSTQGILLCTSVALTSIQYWTSVDGGTNIYFTGAGNVGIGTSTPTARLELVNTPTVIGSELITNGTFTSSALGWTLGTNVVYNAGSGNVTSTYSRGDPSVSTTFSTVAGSTYQITFTVSSSNAPLYYYFSNQSNLYQPLTDGTYTFIFKSTYTGVDTLYFDDYNYTIGDTWTIDDISIREMSILPTLKVLGYDGSTVLSLGGDMLGNTAIGSRALQSNTTGEYNTANGLQALYANTTGYWNTANGMSALSSNTTGGYNTANGANALFSNTTGGSNTANGVTALSSNTTGYGNTANGMSALSSNTTGYSNTANGYNAGNNWGIPLVGSDNTFLGANTTYTNGSISNATAVGANVSLDQSNTVILGNGANVGIGTSYPSAKLDIVGQVKITDGTQGAGKILTSDASGLASWSTPTGGGQVCPGSGADNTCYGIGALASNTTGGYNTANGSYALSSNTTGDYNTANGSYALSSNTTGSLNTANGNGALYFNTTGGDNTANGASALASNTTGNSNTANGRQALASNTTGGYNTANGMNALASNTTGGYNTANGYYALVFNITGNSNTALGNYAGSSITTGSSNIAIGYNSQVASATGSNQLSIGNWIYGTSGNIGIGTTTPWSKLDVVGTGSFATLRLTNVQTDNLSRRSYQSRGLGSGGGVYGMGFVTQADSGEYYSIPYTYGATPIYVTSTGGIRSTFSSNFAFFQGIVTDSQSNVYTSYASANQLYRVTPGDIKTVIALPGYPTHLARDSRDNIYANLSSSNAIAKITAGGAVSTFATLPSDAFDISIDENDNIYAIALDGSYIRLISPNGSVSLISPATGLSIAGLNLIAVSNGNVFVAQFGQNKIYNMSPSGSLSEYMTLPSGIIDLATNPKIGDIVAMTGDGNIYSFPVPDRYFLTMNPGGLLNFSPISADGIWSLSGNTIRGAEFLGSKNNRDLVFKRNNIEGMRLSGASGNLVTTADATINGITVGRGGGNIVSNTANGQNALQFNTTGFQNTANGQNALSSNTTGGWNTANGEGALFSNTTGFNNTANGVSALQYNTMGYLNTANGYQSLFSNITGAYNTANGASTLASNTTGIGNTANGMNALYSNTTGDNNTANGSHALFFNTTGGYNTANGNWALGFNTTGGYNTANGLQALYANTTGYANTANGVTALSSNTTGYANAANGSYALYFNTTGYSNTANGYNAGNNWGIPLVGSDNTFLGANTTYTNGSISNATAVGANVSLDQSNTVILGNGANVGIGTTTPGARLEVAGQIKITGGVPGLNKVLTSDAVGLATWQAPGGGAASYWTLLGNAGTTAGTNFIGTTDAIDLVIKTNNTERMRVTSTGAIGIGTSTPADALDIITGSGRITTGNMLVGAGSPRAAYVPTLTFSSTFNTPGGPAAWNGNTRFTYDNNGFVISQSGGVSGSPLSGPAGFGLGAGGRNADIFITHNGAVGIGTITPSAQFTVSGSIQIVDGTQGAGRVLTSDAVGLASWTTPTGQVCPGSGGGNTCYGIQTLTANTTGAGNTANGYWALASNTMGGSNTANGYWALASNTTGSANTANGLNALALNTTGGQNTANGESALLSNTTGGGNTANGTRALYSNTMGGTNTANGFFALYSNTTGSNNTANGQQALVSNTTGDYNTANGAQTLYSNTTGAQNTANGYYALGSNTTGWNNTALGYNAQVPSATASNQVRIGDTAITYAGIQVAWTVTSDRRWKDDIQSVGLGLDFIRALRPVDYFRKNDTSQKREAGFIAQEVESTLAQFGYQDSGMLNKDDNGYYSLRYNDFFAPIVRAIQELASSVKNNTTEINTLKSENESLKKRLDAIEARLGK